MKCKCLKDQTSVDCKIHYPKTDKLKLNPKDILCIKMAEILKEIQKQGKFWRHQGKLLKRDYMIFDSSENFLSAVKKIDRVLGEYRKIFGE